MITNPYTSMKKAGGVYPFGPTSNSFIPSGPSARVEAPDQFYTGPTVRLSARALSPTASVMPPAPSPTPTPTTTPSGSQPSATADQIEASRIAIQNMLGNNTPQSPNISMPVLPPLTITTEQPPDLSDYSYLPEEQQATVRQFQSSPYMTGSYLQGNPEARRRFFNALANPETQDQVFQLMQLLQSNPELSPVNQMEGPRYGSGFSGAQIEAERKSRVLSELMSRPDFGLGEYQSNVQKWRAAQSQQVPSRLLQDYNDWPFRYLYSRAGGTGQFASQEGSGSPGIFNYFDILRGGTGGAVMQGHDWTIQNP